MSIKKHSFIGCKFFNDEGVILRVKSVRNKELFIMEDENKKVYKMKRKVLEDEFTKLKPIGIFTVFEVNIGSGKKDVICTIHRAKDIEIGIQMPYIAARQSMINLFAAPFENNPYMIPMGCCISNKTCPNNVNFNILLENEGIISSSIVSIYLDDTIESVLRYINTINYDNVIYSFKKKFDPTGERNIGSDLYSFLDNNGWMTEFNNAYNIINLNDDIINMKNNEVQTNIIELERLIEKEIEYKVYIKQIIKYDETVNLSKIIGRDEFLFVRNSNSDNSIFIIKYYKGDKIMIIPKNQKEYYSELIGKLPK